MLPGLYRYKRCEQHRLQNRYHSRLKRVREKVVKAIGPMGDEEYLDVDMEGGDQDTEGKKGRQNKKGKANEKNAGEGGAIDESESDGQTSPGTSMEKEVEDEGKKVGILCSPSYHLPFFISFDGSL